VHWDRLAPDRSAAGVAHGEGADRKRLCELLGLKRELVTGTVDLSDAEPPELDLHIHAIHLMDGTGVDDSSNRAGETELELLAAEVDWNLTLAGEGHFQFAVRVEHVRSHALGEEATW